MFFRVTKYCLFLALFFSTAFLADRVFAQRPTPTPGAGSRPGTSSSPLQGGDPTIDIDVYVKGADGGPIEVTAVVTLVAPMGQVLSQGTTLGGNIKFSGVAASEYTIQVVAPGYENAIKEFDGYNAGASRVTIDMRPASNGGTGAGSSQILLAPKAQKELNKALEVLRADKPAEARSHLDAAYRLAPNHPAVNYLFGVYYFQMKDQEKAKSHWTKALAFDPKHLGALLSLSEAMIQEQKLPDAESYVKRAVEADPNSWRAHAILADVLLKERAPEEAIKEADRAVELGHGQATMVQPLLAQALMEGGNKERAIKVLQEYVQDHPNDATARKQLDRLQAPVVMASASGEALVAEAKPATGTEAAVTVPLPSDMLDPKGEVATGKVGPSAVAPKAQLALNEAFAVLRTNLTARGAEEARSHLETAYKIAPTSAEVNYLFGVYSWQTYDRQRAISYWTKAVEFYPKHYRALLSLGQALVNVIRPAEALPYLERAAQAEPFSWRPHVLAAHVYLQQGSPDQAAKEAERALELGHEEAAVAQKYLAAALAKRGEMDEAVNVLQGYMRNHPADIAAKKQLEKLQAPESRNAQHAAEASSKELLQSDAIAAVTPVPLTTTEWLPADVDERVPSVEPEAACALDEVLQKAGKRVQEFVQNVDRYTASEFLEHESIGKWGFADSLETRKFDYVASIEQFKPGLFSVVEYRSGVRSLSEFPDGVVTNGLPALALVFHANNAGTFAMSCEGLGRWNGRPAWQVHFRQRPDKPNTMREYRLGENGPAYPVALRGRAWIAADSYQIVRMETDLVATVPQIRLLVDHTVVDYGPVRFKKRNVEMWLPQSAEMYSDWRGKRMHRQLSFSNYMLFSVDEKQRISEPKTETEGQHKD